MRDFFDPFLISLLPLSLPLPLVSASPEKLQKDRANTTSKQKPGKGCVNKWCSATPNYSNGATGSVWDFPNDCGDIGLLLSLLGPSAFLS